jgi:hypothetical protein
MFNWLSSFVDPSALGLLALFVGSLFWLIDRIASRTMASFEKHFGSVDAKFGIMVQSLTDLKVEIARVASSLEIHSRSTEIRFQVIETRLLGVESSSNHSKE